MQRRGGGRRLELRVAAHCSGRVEDLDGNAPRLELADRLGLRMHLVMSTGTNDEMVGKLPLNDIEVFDVQGVSVLSPPVRLDPIGQDDHIFVIALAVDDDMPEAILFD